MTRRRWIADTYNATHASLTGAQAQHLARVLRAEPGQLFDVVAGGHLHQAKITSVTDSEVIFLLLDEMLADPALPLHLLLAVFKFDRYEWAIEKATELGVQRITPVLARRTEKHLAQSSAKRVERWRRIALEAAQQSRRSDVPTIDDPIALKAALETATAPQKILLAETEEETSLAAILSAHKGTETALAIGPEGGWAQDEMALFAAEKWHSVTLGPRILRAETAAIAALAIASALL
jgi:16S rRNA (uracil1498-N3)-methyltransferase